MIMTDFVQPTAIQPPIHPALLALASDSTPLQLSGAGPFSVNVQVDANGNAQFSTATAPTPAPKIQWAPTQGQTTLAQFTFTFVAGTNTPTSMIPFLTLNAAGATQQTGSCQPLSANNSFLVNYTTSTGQMKQTSDPIIIVTPPA
jgi:hypothetical protein